MHRRWPAVGCLWRLMIDARYQGRIRTPRPATGAAVHSTFPCGLSEHCWLSYEPGNLTAKRLRNFGFAENGQMDGNEVVAAPHL